MKVEKEVTVQIRRGVHGRVATRLAKIAREYDVSIFIINGQDEIDCSSILDVLSMALVHGTVLRFRARGEQRIPAMAAIEELFSAEENP